MNMDDEKTCHITPANFSLSSYGVLENTNNSSIETPTSLNMDDHDTLAISNGQLASVRNNGIASDIGGISKKNGLSTVSGCFAPVTISMFSALLFLRMGFVAGQLGFLLTTVELFLAYGIILLTVLSLCALSSNGAVEGGGVYYMISRTLGPEFGGSIGLLFFTANVFSCALYITGFTEALTNATGIGQVFGGKFLHCVLVSIVILCLSLLGAEMFAKTALVALFAIIISYGSFIFTIFFKSRTEVLLPHDNINAYMKPENETDPSSKLIIDFNQNLTGTYTSFSVSTFTENLFANYTSDYTTGRATDFAFMFSIIFSGVTGLMAGANMSGELARPSVSIPRGTLQAVITTLLTYILTAFLLCLSCSRHLLQSDYLVMVDTAIFPPLILVGIFAATFFSSMSNMIGASRVLNRLAQDKLLGSLLLPATVELGKSGNPIISVLISWACVVMVFVIGAMNKIAKITSLLFLLSYMGVNIATLALELSSAPNFRPNFKYFSWHSCSLGAISTVIMMLIIDASMSAVSVVLLMLLIMILHYQAPIGSWGSISQALIYHQVRKYLLLLDVRKEHVKFWRPQILLLVNRPASSCALIDFINNMKKSGLYVIGHVQRGSMDEQPIQILDPLQQIYPYWLSLVDYLKIKAFVELTLTENVRLGIQQLIRLSGLGAMKPNTVVIGFHENEPSEATLSESHLLKDLKHSKIGRSEIVEYFTATDFVPKELVLQKGRLETEEYVQVIEDIIHLNKNLCIARNFTYFDREISLKSGRRFIDVWPSHMFNHNKSDDGGLKWDNSSLFVLQLACILSMSSRWKNAVVRVFICVHSLQDVHNQEIQLKHMLEQVRIKAKTVMIPWDHVINQLGMNEQTSDITKFPVSFIKAVNEMIKRSSEGTAICFLNLPLPVAKAAEEREKNYLQSLRLLSQDLPPTLLVHGITSVISMAL